MGQHDWITKTKALYGSGHELIVTFNSYLAAKFGTSFQLAADWVLVGLALVVLVRLLQLSLDVLRYVLVPSVVISGLVAVCSPISFMYVMPLAMGAGTLFLLFKS